MSLIIPLDPIPNQSVSVRLDGRRYVLSIKDIGSMMAVSIERDSVALLSGSRACSGTPLIPYSSLSGEAGNFIFTTTVDGVIPYYTDFGSSCFLTYSTAAEIEAAISG